MIGTTINIGSVYATEQCIDITPKFIYGGTSKGVVYVHGAGSNADYCLSPVGKQAERTNVVSTQYAAIAGDNGGQQTWGNSTSVTRLGGYLSRLQARSDVHDTDYALIGDSMGGIVALNYAAGASVKPKAIVMVIPVININDMVTQNRGGYAAAINAAYGGAYNEGTHGATYNPYTMRAMAKLLNIPMLIFYGLTDELCLPQWTEDFAAADPTKRTLVALPTGHEFATYNAVDHDMILAFLQTHLGT